jgi:quinol-cytochrome oxidoreductase complex cytochrome b subunit
MMLIPAIMAGLIGAHLWLVMKLGITAPPWLKAEPVPVADESDV